MSQQSSGERATTGPSAATSSAEAPIGQQRLPHQAGVQTLPSPSAPQQPAVLDHGAFRAPGVDAILTASHQYASHPTNLPSGRLDIASTSRNERPWTRLSGAKQQPPSVLDDAESSRRTSQSSLAAFGGSDTVTPLEVSYDVTGQGRLLFSSPNPAGAAFISRDIRGLQAPLLEQSTAGRGVVPSTGPGSPFSAHARQTGPASVAPRAAATAVERERIVREEQSHESNVSNENLMRRGEQPPARHSPAIETGTRYMTLQTDQGPMSFPVDIQAASRGADEKRKRNAGASARFRARRKEREQASSREIEDMRQLIRDLSEEVEFYRRERDYMASALQQQSERERHFPRPPSPRRRRLSAQSNEPDVSRGTGIMREAPSLYQERGERGGTERNSRQRLVGEFAYGTQPTAMSPSSQGNFRGHRSFSSQPGFAVPQPLPQLQPAPFLRPQEPGTPFTASKTPPSQDQHLVRDLPRIYAPPSTRGAS